MPRVSFPPTTTAFDERAAGGSSHSKDTAPLAHADVVVLDYLAALWAESEGLAPELRDELMTTVADYIAARRTSVSDPISDPEEIVGRLGPPEAIVASV